MSKTLQAKVQLNSSQAEKALARIYNKINQIEKLTNKTSRVFNGVDKTLKTAANQAAKLKKNTDGVAKSAAKAKKEYSKMESTIAGLAKKILGLVATGLALTVAVETSDKITSAENKINSLNGNDTGATQDAMDKMYAAAQNSRTGYADMLANVSKSMTLSPDAFQGNIDNAIRFQEIMAKSYALGGASAAEQSSSMYQMIQALGSGRLQGDELRSVTEGAPKAAKAIEKFAQEFYNTKLALKEMGSQGMITSDLVVAAMMKAGADIDEQFLKTKRTFAQVWTSIKNTATKAFEPVLQKLNKALNAFVDNGGLEDLTFLLNGLATILGVIADVTLVVAENWDWLKYIFYALATIIGIVSAAMVTLSIKTTIAGIAAKIAGNTALVAWMKALWPLLLIVAVIGIVLALIKLLGVTISEYVGVIVGIVMAAVALIWNLLLGLFELVLGIVNYWFNIFAAFFNFFANAWKDPIGSAIKLFGDLADVALGVLESIAKAMDFVLGTSMADTVAGWRSSLNGKIEAAVSTHGNGKYEEVINQIELSPESFGLKRWDYGDAFLTGYDWGESGANWIGEKLGGLNQDYNFDPNGAYDMEKALSDIAGDVGNISDSMDLTEDDVKYLRKLAELEWKKEFTTANITVQMDNSGATINNEGDLDGLVTKLNDKLREELYSTANGVYV